MAVKVHHVGNAGMTLYVTVQRLSDNFYFNTDTEAFESAPTFTDKRVAMTEGTSENVGSYACTLPEIGSPKHVLLRVHNAGAANSTVAHVKTYIVGDIEYPQGLLEGSGTVEFTYTVSVGDPGVPIGDVDVWVTTDEAGVNVIASGRTNQDGEVIFYLDVGTLYFWSQKTGFNFTNPQAVSVTEA